MSGYYDEYSGDWVDLGDEFAGFEQLDNTSGTQTIDNLGQTTYTYDDGSTLIVDDSGNPISSTESTDSTGSSIAANSALAWINKNLGSTAASAFTKMMASPGATLGTALAAAKMLSGGNAVQTGGYSKAIPKMEQVRQQVQYNDPNRVPGSAGRQYFTDAQYIPQGDEAAKTAAMATANTQAQGILAARPAAAAPAANPYAGKMNRGFAAAPVAAPAPAGLPASSVIQTNPIPPAQGTKMAHGGIAGFAHGGRYLQGNTDGMADELPTSIDGKQPAALSHGEFVIPADVVSHLGNGNSDAGAEKLYDMMSRIRKARTGNEKQGKEINPDKFMPGGLAAAYAAGGSVRGFATGDLVPGATSPTATPAASVPSYGSSTSSSLSPWAGDYVTNMLGQGQAAAAAPYQAYTGQLTAGPSNLQQQAFTGASENVQGGYNPTTFTGGAFNAQAAQQYMNPYLQASLDPQLKELQRQAQIGNMTDAAKLTQGGAYGGGRQAVLMGEQNRNLLDKSSGLLSSGYNTAFTNAQQQFNADQARNLQTQQASEASRQYGADYGLKALDQLSGMGATQRDITQQGLTADQKQFEEQRDYALKMPQYQKDLLTGLPITTNATTSNTTQLGQIGSSISNLQSLYDQLAKLGVTPEAATPTTTTPAK
jgi:hypothetical protein